MQDKKVVRLIKARSKALSTIKGKIKGYPANEGKIKRLFCQQRQDKNVIQLFEAVKRLSSR